MTHSDIQRRPSQQQILRHKPYYTDMGPDVSMRDSDGVTSHLPRYAVWTWDTARGKHQVAEVSDDLDALRAKHGEGPLVHRPRLATPD